MKIQIPKSKDFTQRRKGIAKKTFAYSLRLCDFACAFIFVFFGSGLSGLGTWHTVPNAKTKIPYEVKVLSGAAACGSRKNAEN